MDGELRFIKVSCALLSSCAAGVSIVRGFSGNGGLAIIFGALAADLFRVAFNSCTKNYCIMLMRKLSSTAHIANSFVQWATTSLGINSSADDGNLYQMDEDLHLDILINGTLTEGAIKMVKNLYRN